MTLAPIILFAYNRPSHTLKTLEALAQNDLANESLLYVFADGIKANASADAIQNIKKTREILKSKQWCKEVQIVERAENFGLARSVIDGVTEIVNKHGKVIVLEDDLVTSRYFLKFMNETLDRYEKEESVACISAYIYPIKDLPELFFIKGADCWGWGTWKRAWDLFEPNGNKLLNELEGKKLTSKFDLNSSYPYTKMLREQISGLNNSWAIRWYASSFLKNKLCLYPGHSLVNNIGTDGSGTHNGSTDLYSSEPIDYPIVLKEIKIEASKEALNKMSTYFKGLDLMGRKQPLLRRLVKSIVPDSFIAFYRRMKNN